jgi:hypothetical protein
MAQLSHLRNGKDIDQFSGDHFLSNSPVSVDRLLNRKVDEVFEETLSCWCDFNPSSP